MKELLERFKQPRGAWLIVAWLLGLGGAACSIAVVALEAEGWWVYLVYTLAALFLAYAIYALVKFVPRASGSIAALGKKYPALGKWLGTYEHRTLLFSACSFVVNVGYVVLNLVIAVLTASLWYGALAAYTEAARAETESEMGYGAPLVYAYFVAGRKIAEHYDEAERYVSMIYETLSDANNAYIANRLLSVFAEAKGDTEKAEYYGHKADALLDGMIKDAKPLFFKAIKVAPGDCGSQKEIAAEMKRGRFVLRDYGDGCLWERKRTFGMQYVSIVSLYDVVCVTAYISWRDVMAGQTCVDGLNGFIGCAIKIPLKRFVKKLVKKISARAECGKPCEASEKSVR